LEDLSKQSEIYKYMLDKAKDIILLLDEKGRIIYANTEATKCYGYSLEELLNLNIANLRSEQKIEFAMQNFDFIKEHGMEFETMHYKKDRTTFPVELKAIGLEINNKKYAFNIIRDITIRKRDEQYTKYLASIVESSQDAIFGYDLNGIITSCNNAAEKIYGYSKFEMIGQHISLVMADIEDDSYNILQSIKNNEKIKLDKRIRKRKDGAKIYVSVQVSPIRDMKDNIIGASAISRDVSSIMAKEKELAENYQELSALYEQITAFNEELTANEEELRSNYIELEAVSQAAEKANRAKSQFLANMSHELRTPMNGVLGILELLSYTKLSSEQAEYVQVLKSSSKHLLEVINDLLDISRIEAGKLQLNFSKFNLRNSVDKLLRQASFSATDKSLDIMYSIDPMIGYEYIGDEVRFNQVLINLISNAIKFTERGNVFVRLKKIDETNDNIKLRISVEDTGIGVPKDFGNDIFKMFTQADYSNTRKFGGTGLGLAISKQIVEMMDGEIWFESVEGKGSTFYFTAILNKISEEYVENNIKKTQIARYTQEKTILVAEDNETNRIVISGFLKKLNYEYDLVKDGQEVIDALKIEDYDIILMDVQMPGVNGIEATKIIRQNEEGTGKHIPIIAMTARAMAGDKENLIANGMDDYISKPFDIDTLFGVIERYIK
jgi:PAS domain S-box-containing protein